MASTKRITTKVQMRLGDVDLAQQVHHAAYLHYLELGRMELMGQFLERDHDWNRTGMILARMELDYRKPLRLLDQIQVQTWCGKIGAKSFDLLYEVQSRDGGTIFAEGRSVMVCFNYVDQCVIEVPSAWSASLARMMGNEEKQ